MDEYFKQLDHLPWMVIFGLHEGIKLINQDGVTIDDSLTFNDDGTKLSVVSSNKLIHHYKLNHGFDISTAVHVTTATDLRDFFVQWCLRAQRYRNKRFNNKE